MFTASQQSYADPIISRIEASAHITFEGRFFQHDCQVSQSGRVIKDLEIIPDLDMGSTLIVDDNESVTGLYPENSIKVSKWEGSETDRQLSEVLSTLEVLREMPAPVSQSLRLPF